LAAPWRGRKRDSGDGQREERERLLYGPQNNRLPPFEVPSGGPADGVDEHIYWFPAEMVVDPFTGAVEYVPLA